MGGVNIHYCVEVASTTAVSGAEEDPEILGVTAQETLGFNGNPTNGELHRVDALI